MIHIYERKNKKNSEHTRRHHTPPVQLCQIFLWQTPPSNFWKNTQKNTPQIPEGYSRLVVSLSGHTRCIPKSDPAPPGRCRMSGCPLRASGQTTSSATCGHW